MKARDTPLSPEEAEAHRLAGLDRISKELCEDLALKHAKTVDSEVGYRFREIASYLYRLRRKPLNAQQEKDLSRALSELDRVLLKPVGGPAMDETEMDPREIQALSQCLIAQDAAGFSPFTLADILIRQWERDRKRKMFRRNLNKMMVRCCGDNKSPHNWLSRSPIFSPLLVEWNRDRDALWDFIEACVIRWSRLKEPINPHRTSVILHQNAASLKRDWPRMLGKLQKKGLIEPPGSARMQESLLARLRKVSSRETAAVRVAAKARKDESAHE